MKKKRYFLKSNGEYVIRAKSRSEAKHKLKQVKKSSPLLQIAIVSPFISKKRKEAFEVTIYPKGIRRRSLDFKSRKERFDYLVPVKFRNIMKKNKMLRRKRLL